jgi:hypothetical protein
VGGIRERGGRLGHVLQVGGKHGVRVKMRGDEKRVRREGMRRADGGGIVGAEEVG